MMPPACPGAEVAPGEAPLVLEGEFELDGTIEFAGAPVLEGFIVFAGERVVAPALAAPPWAPVAADRAIVSVRPRGVASDTSTAQTSARSTNTTAAPTPIRARDRCGESPTCASPELSRASSDESRDGGLPGASPLGAGISGKTPSVAPPPDSAGTGVNVSGLDGSGAALTREGKEAMPRRYENEGPSIRPAPRSVENFYEAGLVAMLTILGARTMTFTISRSPRKRATAADERASASRSVDEIFGETSRRSRTLPST